MFSYYDETPTEHELALAAEQRLFDAIQHTHRFPRVGAQYDQRATARLTHTWQVMLAGIHECTRRITEARMSLPTEYIADALAACANPQAVNAKELIDHLPTLGASVHQGPIAACELLAVLVRAGYRMSGSEVDGITRAFDQVIFLRVSGDHWVGAGCPDMSLIRLQGVRA